MEYTWIDALLGLTVGGLWILCLWLTRERGAEWWPGKGWVILAAVLLIIATEWLISI